MDIIGADSFLFASNAQNKRVAIRLGDVGRVNRLLVRSMVMMTMENASSSPYVDIFKGFSICCIFHFETRPSFAKKET